MSERVQRVPPKAKNKTKQSRIAQAQQTELVRMGTMVVAPIPLGHRKAVPEDMSLAQCPTDSQVRWCTYGFLMAAEWFRRQDVEPPTKQYLAALAAMYGLPMPVMEIE